MDFEWDTNKDAANQSKHGVSFNEAKTVFEDPLFVVFDDPNHSIEEERYLIIGLSVQNRVLIVAYSERGNKTRLISARKATPQERKDYEEG